METVVQVGMMQSWAGKSLTIFLTVSVLAGSVLPPAYSHSHLGGNEQHDHGDDPQKADQSHHHCHHHHGDGHLHHPLSKATDNSANDLRDANLHWHVTLFVFDFTLPSLPGQQDESENDFKQPSVVARVIDLSRVLPAECGRTWLTSLELVDVNPIDAIAEETAALSRNPHDARILLCDIARRERSGVLLT